jgi:hypothetical protein
MNCLPIDKLNLVYNTCDVGVNTCIGEGWGLVNFEHAATRTAQIVPDHTSLKEIFGGIPRIPIESWEVDCNYGLDRGVPSVNDLVRILDNYYEHRDNLDKVAQWCYDELQDDKYSWITIGANVLKIVNKTLGQTTAGKGFGDE